MSVLKSSVRTADLLSDVPPSETLGLLYQVARDQQSVKYVVVSAFVVMLYDNLMTIPEELTLFWGPRRSKGSILFFITRWPVLFESLLYLVYSLDFKSSETFCKMEAYLTAWGALLFVLPLQAVIILRTIALWERSRTIIIILVTSAMATDITLFALLINVSVNMKYKLDPIYASFLGCEGGLINFNPKDAIPCYMAIIAFDTIIFILTVYRALRAIRRTHLFVILVRDGFIYYTVMLAIAVSAVSVSLALPFERSSLIALFAPIIKASFCIVGSRISLNLREALRITDDSRDLDGRIDEEK